MGKLLTRPAIKSVPLIIAPPNRMHGRVLVGANWHARYWNPVLRPRTGTRKGWEYGEAEIANIVVTAGLNHGIDVVLSGGSQDTTWFVFLMDGTPTVNAADTMGSHAGWTEVTAYDEATREAFVDAGPSAGAVTNTASPAAFTIDTNSTTIGGAGLCGVSTKGDNTGVFYAGGAFGSGDLVLNDGAALEVDATFSYADDGV